MKCLINPHFMTDLPKCIFCATWFSKYFLFLHFVTENVPSSWVEKKDGRTFCLWPKKLSGDKISKLIKNRASPAQAWDLCSCTIQYECASYEESRIKCQEAAHLTFTEASTDEEMDHQSLNDSSSSSKSLPPSHPKKKLKKHAKPVDGTPM